MFYLFNSCCSAVQISILNYYTDYNMYICTKMKYERKKTFSPNSLIHYRLHIAARDLPNFPRTASVHFPLVVNGAAGTFI